MSKPFNSPSILASFLNRAFPTPRYLTFNPVALDISPNFVRIMRLKSSKDGLIPKDYREVRLEKRIDVAEYLGKNKKKVNKEELKELLVVLKNLKKEFKFNYAIVSLPEVQNYIFRSKLPNESAGDVSSAIRFGLEEYVPLSVDKVNFDYFSIKEEIDSDPDNLDIIVSAFPKELIFVYTKILQMAEISPLSFESESVAMARSVVAENDYDPYLLVRLLEDKVGIAIVENGVVQYASSIPIKSKDIIEGYEKSQAGEELMEILNKLLIFWFTNKKENIQHSKIQTGLITGRYAKAPGMQEFLERHLKINIEVGNVWTNCFSADEFIPDLDQETALNFAVAIGMSIKTTEHA